MSVQRGSAAAGPGIPQKGISTLLHLMNVSVGQIERNTAKRLNQNLPGKGRAAVHIAVSGHLIKQDIRVFLMDVFSVTIMITQVDHGIRSECLDTFSHETEGPV
jgi:hypothetical protein